MICPNTQHFSFGDSRVKGTVEMVLCACMKMFKEGDGEAKRAAQFLKKVRNSGGKLLIMTGAGMSVQSGVPVFRNADGSMSPDFLRFLGDYNKARKRAGLPQANDWFDFSVAQMFRKETEKEAWAYWRWRILRALVEPAQDYQELQKLVEYFGQDKTFTNTSNCDMLHQRAGSARERVREIHGCLGRVQCAFPDHGTAECGSKLHSVDDAFLQRLRNEPEWVPRCPLCKNACLRPNVMIFMDDTLINDTGSVMYEQGENYRQFTSDCRQFGNFAVLEVGAGVVVSSIRSEAEITARSGEGLVRVNPSADECRQMQNFMGQQLAEAGKYFPIVQRSGTALAAITSELGL